MKYLLLLLLFPFSISVAAQNSNDSTRTQSNKDTVSRDYVHKMQKRGRDEAIKSIETYNRGKISLRQHELLEEVKQLNQQIKLYLKSGIDTIGINLLLERTKAAVAIVKDGIFTNKGSNQTQRNLVVSSDILTELSERLEKKKNLLDIYANQLASFRVKSDSLQGDSAVYVFPSDSLKIVSYIKRLMVVVKEMGPIDSALNKTLASTEALQVQVDLAAFELHSLKEDIDIYSNNLSNQSLGKEFPYLWEKPIYARPFNEILNFSLAKERMILAYYMPENILTICIMFIAIGCSFIFLRSLKQQLRQDNNLHDDFSDQLVVRYPLLSAILFAVSIFQFFFY